MASQGPVAHGPRNVLRRVLERYSQAGLQALIGPELEFFLLRPTEDGRLERYLDRNSMVYTTGKRADPLGVVREMLWRTPQRDFERGLARG